MSSTPIVVQGYSVYSQGGPDPQGKQRNDGYAVPPSAASVPAGNAPPLHGPGPERQFRDVLWAFVFLIHLAGMIFLIALGASSKSYANNNNASGRGGIIFLASLSALFAVILSTLSLGLMMKFARTFVEAGLIFSVLSSLLLGLYGFAMGQKLLGVLGLICFALGMCYAYVVWHRIPFAAANLNTALTGVRANLGLAVVGYLMLAAAFTWSVFWSIAFSNYLQGYQSPILFLLLVSFYWVHQVLQNTVHVIVAGVIGSWWFVPAEASSFWSTALSDSLFRATTYSFGSICFGSLLVAIVQALRALLRISEQNEDCNILTCLIQCILACIQGIIEELNKWAYVYIGLYGQSYLEAGRNVLTLFEYKGWTVIVTDDLADNVLWMVSIGIGLATGLVGLIQVSLSSNLLNGLQGLFGDNARVMAFFVCFLVGYVFATIMMSIVASAVNTVIVCFAEAPAELQMNHPQLSAEMRASWMHAWPELSL